VSRTLLVALLLLAAESAHGFVRTTTCPDRPRHGQCLWWSSRQVPYVLNTSGFLANPSCATESAAADLARRSVATWSQATRPGEGRPCTDFAYAGGASAPSVTALGRDGQNVIVFRKSLCSSVPDPRCQSGDPDQLGACVEATNCWSHDSGGAGSIIALTTSTYVASTGEILDADIELHGWDGQSNGWYFTCGAAGLAPCAAGFGGANCTGMDIGSTVTHESGHVLGLGHVCLSSGDYLGTSCDPDATMAPTATSGDTGKRVLGPDDVEGVCAIYPIGAAVDRSSGCIGDGEVYGDTACAVTSGLVELTGQTCGSTGASGLALLALAILAWRLRRSPR